MKRTFLLVVAAFMAFGLMAGPAAAVDGAGVIIGANALVSKTVASNGCPTPGGAGIGFPILHENGKKAYYSFNGGTATATIGVNAQTGTVGSIIDMLVCGQVDPAELTGIGAACGSSSGNNGKSIGAVTFNDGSQFSLSGVGWDVSVGGAFVVTGSVDNGSKTGGLLALVQARSATCQSKSGSGSTKTGGAGTFLVDIVYVVGDNIPNVKHTKQ